MLHNEDYQYVLGLNPFNEDAYVMKGKLPINKGNLPAADLFTDAIELKPDFAKAFAEEDGPTRCWENRERGA